MKATGIVRRIDDLGRVVIPKEIRRTMRIREGDPLMMTLGQSDIFCVNMLDLSKLSIPELIELAVSILEEIELRAMEQA